MIERAWRSIDGWKTFIGGLLHAIWFGIYVYGSITKEYEIESEIQIRGHLILGVWTGVGLWGKYQKNKDSINSGMNKVKQTFKNK